MTTALEPQIAEVTRAVGATIQGALPRGMGFVLVVATPGTDGTTTCVTNVVPEEARVLLDQAAATLCPTPPRSPR